MAAISLALGMSFAIAPAWAADAVMQALKDRQGKSATVVLQSGAELTGTVASVDKDSVRLSGLSGKEFFDAVIDLSKVQAVLYRARAE
jgi:hypothetical protein